MMNSFSILRSENGVHLLTEPNRRFETVYLDARRREGWIYPDEQLRQLPAAAATDPHAALWQLRAGSMERFVQYAAALKQPLHILEIGCGNGWFSHAIAKALPNATVFGLDINLQELQQAALVFPQERLHWLYGDLFSTALPARFFRLLVFNGSLHYFSDLAALFDRLLPALAAEGEIHILDSPFYPQAGKAEAAERTKNYYEKLGVAAMAAYYHAHSIEELAAYHPTLLHNPAAWNNRFRRLLGVPVNPLPWIRLRP